MHLLPFSLEKGIVSENSKCAIFFHSDRSLALMEMRCTLARLIWHFDLSPKEDNQSEPFYDHIRISAGKLEILVKENTRE